MISSAALVKLSSPILPKKEYTTISEKPVSCSLSAATLNCYVKEESMQ